MASSRWKRFAFFDRHSLNLPPQVVQDILPPSLVQFDEGTTTATSTTTTTASGGGGGLIRSVTQDSSLQSLDLVNKGDVISLAVTNGARISQIKLEETLLSFNDSDANTNNNNQNDVNKKNSRSFGIKGMMSSLTACATSIPSSSYSNDQTLTLDTVDNNESFIMQFSPDGLPITSSIGNNTTTSNPSSGNQQETIPMKNGYVEGSLILAFVSSRASSLIHCIDLTVRCTPLNQTGAHHSSTTTTSAAVLSSSTIKNTTSKTTIGSIREETPSIPIDLENLDGWRGFLNPFIHDAATTEEYSNNNASYNVTSSTTAPKSANMSTNANVKLSSTSSQQKRIIAIAVSSDQDILGPILNKNIYLASITDERDSIGVSVLRNPHYYLNDVDTLESLTKATYHSVYPSSTTSSGNNSTIPKSDVYQPSRKFDFTTYGIPCCVDISHASEIVAVGTDKGSILIYGFDTSPTASTKGGLNGTSKLHFIMEIPTPPIASIRGKKVGSYAISSLKIITEQERGGVGGINMEGSSSSTYPSNQSRGGNKSVKTGQRTKIFVTYRRNSSNALRNDPNTTDSNTKSNVSIEKTSKTVDSVNAVGVGVCCFDLGCIGPYPFTSHPPANRLDLDGRDVNSSCICDLALRRVEDSTPHIEHNFVVARSNGLYTYSSTDKVSVSPIDGTKIAMCSIPQPPIHRKRFHAKLSKVNCNTSSEPSVNSLVDNNSSTAVESGAFYHLVATTDAKSGRDAVDIYDASNKLVAFHILLSPGHKTLRACGITTYPRRNKNGSSIGGLSSALIVTSGGSIVTLTERVTSEKVSLLVQKNLYSAAISIAFADPSYQSSDITALYTRHAEHLYRKGDFVAAMNQYIYTIGSLEPSHVIFRFLDAPKIPLLVKYLEELRSRKLSTSVHDELLRTCYLKLNDQSAAEKIYASLSKAMDPSSCMSMVSDAILQAPLEAMALVCSFEAPQAAEALALHGSTLARSLPRETAGLVVALCDGAYSPKLLAEAAAAANVRDGLKGKGSVLKETLDKVATNRDRTKPDFKVPEQVCDCYPIDLFSSSFLENPKLLRTILAHCYQKKRRMSPSLKRSLLELTLEEWKTASRNGDSNSEATRRDEAISMLTDVSCSDMGDYETLVLVKQAGFREGEIKLYEKLHMTHFLVEEYAKDGSYKARRQMLALCRNDPELLSDVLGHFVGMVTSKSTQNEHDETDDLSVGSDSEIGEILEHIKEALSMARMQDVLPPVSITKLLAGFGEGTLNLHSHGFSSDRSKQGVPLSVALDYVGGVLDESTTEIERLRNEIQEYSALCDSTEAEIKSILMSSSSKGKYANDKKQKSSMLDIDIEEMYASLLNATSDIAERKTEASSEQFWREMVQSEDRYETISRFFAKGIVD